MTEVMAGGEKQKGKKSGRKFEILQIMGEVVLLCWIFWIFYYYYKQQGFFSLIQQLYKGVS